MAQEVGTSVGLQVTQELKLSRPRRLHYMFGSVTQGELNTFLDVTSVDSESRKQEIRQAWRAAASRFEYIRSSEGGAPETVGTEAIDPSTNPQLARLAASPSFVSTFQNYSTTFEMVEIAKLVAAQRVVHINYIEKLRADFDRDPDAFRFCLFPREDATPVVMGRTAPNAFTATSENPSLRFLGVYERPYEPGLLNAQLPGGQPVRAVVLVLGYGVSTANAYRVGRRLILGNGFHRLYALASKGVTHAPLVVQEVSRPQLELPPVIAELPRDYVVQEPRPALLGDFLDQGLCCEVLQRDFTKVSQVVWQVNDGLIPR